MDRRDGIEKLVAEFRGIAKGDVLSMDHLIKLTSWSEPEVSSAMRVVFHLLRTYFINVQEEPGGGYKMIEDHLCPVCGVGTFEKTAPVEIDYLCNSCGDVTGPIAQRKSDHSEREKIQAIPKYERGPDVDWFS